MMPSYARKLSVPCVTVIRGKVRARYEQQYELICLQAQACNLQVLAWLRCKVKVLRNALVDSSASFAGLASDSLTIYAVTLLGEYLPEEWTRRLADSCQVSLGVLLAFDLSESVHLCRDAVKRHITCTRRSN